MSDHTIHTITKSIVRLGALAGRFRVSCSCGEFDRSAPRRSLPLRRRLDRLMLEHLASAAPGQEAEIGRMAIAIAIDGPLCDAAG